MTWRDASLGARLSDFVVLAHDPSVPAVAADWWEISGPHYESVVRALTGLVDDASTVVADQLARLVASPTDLGAAAALATSLDRLLEAKPAERAALAELAARADEHILIDYHCGGSLDGAAQEVTVDDVRRPGGPRPELASGPKALVVIPFRDRVGGARARNLLAALSALRDQRSRTHDVVVTVVESDSEPRWSATVDPWVDHYLFAPSNGHFNKSWAVNVGVRQSPLDASAICVLDADILVDDRFVERNLTRFEQRPDLAAFLPYRKMYCLDDVSSNAAIRARCDHGEPETDLERIRALILREPPGACLWVRAERFRDVGGFDERFQGWGGEDDDMVARLDRAGGLARFDDPLIHLAHPRPQMLLDGKPFNAHIKPMSWLPDYGYGDLRGPVAIAE